MSQVIIENPILNSPFREPTGHFRFADEGITNEVMDGRRTSSYFIPIAQPRKKGQKQLQFDIEWTKDRIEEKQYHPDFIAVLDDGHRRDDPLNLLIEVTGEKKKDKAAKVATARTLWVPAVNNRGGFGRWAFVEIDAPWNAQATIKAYLVAQDSTHAHVAH